MIENGSVVRGKRIADGKWIIGCYFFAGGMHLIGTPALEVHDNGLPVDLHVVDPETISNAFDYDGRNREQNSESSRFLMVDVPEPVRKMMESSKIESVRPSGSKVIRLIRWT